MVGVAEPPPDNGITAPQGGSAYMAIDQTLVGRILAGCSNQSAPGEDRMRAEIVKLLWSWDLERIANVTRLCVQVGTHPESWKTAKGIVIPKPGKPDYRQVRAHRVIALLDSLGKLVEKTAAHLIADQLERKRSLHEGQYGCRRRRLCVDAVAVLISDAQQACMEPEERRGRTANGRKVRLQQCQQRPPDRPHDSSGGGKRPSEMDRKLRQRTKG